MEIVNLLPSLIEKDLRVFISKLQTYKYLIFEKILSQKNAFIIDNIQFADTFLAIFFMIYVFMPKISRKIPIL